jgi:hypothetical protein
MNHEAEIGINQYHQCGIVYTRATVSRIVKGTLKPCLRLINSIQGLTATSMARIVVIRP